MNINDLPGGTPDRVNSASSKIKTPHTRFASGKSAEGEDTKQAQHIRDPEVAELLNRLTDSPEVRTELVEEIRQSIKSGEFFSRQSAEATAEAFLR